MTLLALLACTGTPDPEGGGPDGPISDYQLILEPIVANNQDPFDDLDEAFLVLDPEIGDEVRVPLDGVESGATAQATDLPALENATISFEGVRDGAVVAWGRTVALDAASGEDSTRIFVAETETAAWLAPLPEALWSGVMAPLGEGRFLLAGGMGNNRTGEPEKLQDVVYTLTLAPPDDTVEFEVIGALPTYRDGSEEDHTGRMGATLTALQAAGDDQGLLLLAGGSSEHPYAGSATTVTASVMLYDPGSDAWEALDDNKDFTRERTQHLAIENVQGNVVFWGGWGWVAQSNSITWNNSFEVYDRASRSVSRIDDELTDLGPYSAAAADLASDGTLVCGGAIVTATTFVNANACYTVSIDGSSAQRDVNLPTALAGHAMITLDDGRVLLTGGAADSTTREIFDVLPAQANAFLLSPSTGQWVTIQSMRMARAGHRMSMLPDGRVLVSGGAESFAVVTGPDDPVSCLEIFDPATSTFSTVDDCDTTDDGGGLPSRAFEPMVAADPVWGVVIAGGRDAEGSAQDVAALFVPAP